MGPLAQKADQAYFFGMLCNTEQKTGESQGAFQNTAGSNAGLCNTGQG